MNSTVSQPKLPTWLFIVTDIALVGLAILIGQRAGNPMSKTAILAIVGCVVLAMFLGLVPLVVRLERKKNEALDDRQHALEALARTVASSAEQISIAANGLHEIADIAQKNLRHAEQLPHKLQEKIAEFQAQLAAAEDTEKEELERELLSLRTSESERLESVSQRIAKSAAEWAKLEATLQQHLTAANDALGKLSLGTAAAIGKAQAAAEQALTHARTEAAKNIGEASGKAAHAIEAAKTAALADFETKVAAAIERAARALDGKLAQLEKAAHAAPQAAPAPDAAHAPAPQEHAPTAASVATATPDAPPVHAPAPESAAVAKRPRKQPRREEPAAETPAAESAASSAAPAVAEPMPVPAERIAEVAPIAPHTAEPFRAGETNGGAPHAEAPAPEPRAPGDAAETAKPRKRAAKKTDAPREAGLALEMDDAPAVTGAPSERVLSSDGATRLLVTAYIGIGNRLFIRGDGPGLTWDKGVPLQFVSIGKWRWETNEANAPLHFKIYKNDDTECAALGAQTLDPGYQQELTAPF